MTLKPEKVSSRAAAAEPRSIDLKKLRPRFEAAIEMVPEAGCWLWVKALGDKTGHGVIGDGRGRPSKLLKAHRLAWMLYRGPIPEGLSVLHKCDVGCCCNPEHLYLGAQQDNLRDSKASGKLGPGRNCGAKNGANCRLTEAQVLYLRRKDLPRGTLTACAKLWNISRTYISYLRAYKKWKHV